MKARPFCMSLASALVCALAAATCAAAGGPGLKLSPTLTAPAAPASNSQANPPIFIDADQLGGTYNKSIEAHGDVRLHKGEQSLYADQLHYNQVQDEVTATGRVKLQQYGDVLSGPKLKLNLTTDQGFMNKPDYSLHQSGGRGSADKLFFEGKHQYRAEQGDYTTCPCGNDDWYLRANQLDIDQDRNVGVAHGASLVFKGVPIAYTPYWSFPLHAQRKSGFLLPSIGNSGKTGLTLSIPYYWNIAPNMDATITPEIMGKRGVLLSNEFRYLEPTFNGTAHYEVLPSDNQRNGENRSAFFWQHTQSLPYGWYGWLDIERVSDDFYFTDLSTQLQTTSQVLLPREGALSKSGLWGDGEGLWTFQALVSSWQTLQTDPLVPVTPPYNRRPELTFTASKPDNLGWFDFDFTGMYDDFSHPTMVNGRRLLANPTLSMPLQNAYAYVTPKIGVNMARYQLTDPVTPGQPSALSRTVPTFSTETGLTFERNITAWTGQKMTQTLEPKLYYVYIPFRDQSQIPIFDTGLQDLNFATIFSDNQFSGGDRVNDANQLTAGVISRFIDPDTGAEQLRVGVAQRYYFTPQRVTLPGVAPRTDDKSDILAIASGTIVPNWNADFSWQYTPYLGQTQRFYSALRYQPAAGKVINVGYNYNQQYEYNQIDLSAQWPINSRWTVLGRWNYSMFDNRTLEALGGFAYNAGCWGVRVVAHRFATATTDATTSVVVQLELNGLTNLGSNPLSLLQQNIGGYMQPGTQSQPQLGPFPIY